MTESGTEKSHSAPPFLGFGFRPPFSEISGSAPGGFDGAETNCRIAHILAVPTDDQLLI